ncbi:MAG: acyl-CoA/acyl-ACP dehydrogenase [Spirochaetes bacterium]|nr:acyl-CoA/acyl-ACP dehydrogenase [Spirochaetota bacterium]
MDTLSCNDIAAFEKLTNDFCKKRVAQYIDEHHPDGNFSLLPSLFEEAYTLGIIPAAQVNAPGYEYGVWGTYSHASAMGIHNTLTMLKTLATVCASFAFLAHIQGISTHILIHNNVSNNFLFPFLALYTDIFPPYYSTLTHPSSYHSSYSYENNHCILQTLGYGHDPCYAIVCIPHNNTWHICYFETLDSVLLQPHNTHGLRGMMYSARFNSLPTQSFVIDVSRMMFFIACLWLGIAAIALGIATSAYDKTLQYANQRYQRGGIIKHIESVQMLLGTAFAYINTAQKMLFNFDMCDSSSLLHHAAVSKLTVTTLCTQAVTNCLQVFGGYGYMEDFGIEKKFRDCTTLQTIGGSPFFMRQFIAQMEMEE